MDIKHTDNAPGAGLPVITRRDIDRFVLEGKRLRAQEGDKLGRAAGRGLARLGRALAAPVTAAAEAAGLTRRIGLAGCGGASARRSLPSSGPTLSAG